MHDPLVVIHGGCGRFEGQGISLEAYDEKLRPIVAEGFDHLGHHSAEETVLHVMRLLEDEEIFNSGTGSKLQRDGQARMSAAFMDGNEQRFSAVINVEGIRHPIDLAHRLHGEPHTVLAGEAATRFARQESFEAGNPVTPLRLKEHLDRRTGDTGTCGAVVVDSEGRLCVATSTGGIGYEVPGRVGDSPTVAGTFASGSCGVSCTGVGEHIVNEAVAAAIVTRVSDGMTLAEAVRRSIEAGEARDSHFGLIAATTDGEIEIGQTEGVTVLFAKQSGNESETFLDRLAG